MSELTGINIAIRELSELWQVCTDDDQCEELLNKRDELDVLATQLADQIIREGTDELDEAIFALNELTQTAISAKTEIDDTVEKIRKTAEVIAKATSAIGKIGALIV